jgi:hypothetical protein
MSRIRPATTDLRGPLKRNLPAPRVRGRCCWRNVSSENFVRHPVGAVHYRVERSYHLAEVQL